MWRAENIATGETVALKFPRVSEFISHLRREALMAARFQDEHVVGILQVCLDQEPPFLVIPFVPGSNLELPYIAPQPHEIVSAFRHFRKIVEVVARLHDAEIVHGDLKPGNIRFDRQGKCHILDLGLARQQVSARQASTLRASVHSVTGEKIAGTLEFMAPEVLAGAKPSRASDVYALGVILHALLCGRPPAFGVSPAELNAFLPPGTTDFLRQMLRLDPNRRLDSARALLPTVDALIRAEERCLRRRNGHARRRVFHERMRTLGRGIKILGWATLAIMFFAVGLPAIPRERPPVDLVVSIAMVIVVPLAFVGLVLGMTTINAWIVGIPEKSYKNRKGHPWWTFMMQ